jgi:hypothetical protein
MFTSLNALVAHERYHDMLDQAARQRGLVARQTPVSRVVLREAAAADSRKLRELAELDSSCPLQGSVLVAEVDGRLRAALPLEGGCAIADPFYRGQELVELLRIRAAQLRTI